MSGLTDFQAEVARLFFSLEAADGFLLAGGGALIATGMTDRPTQDLDFFGAPGSADPEAVVRQLTERADERGWSVTVVQESATFARLLIDGPTSVSVDVAIDTPPGHPPTLTTIGPTFDPRELAGRKLAALFGRAAARDFVDVFLLARRFDRTTMLEEAARIDLGLDHQVLADMFATLARFSDDELPIATELVPDVRAFFAEWERALRT